MNKGNLIIISGPSKSGKDTIIAGLIKIKDLNIKKIGTYTTRPRRTKTEDFDQGFLSEKDFDKKINGGFFLEWTKVHGYKYGSPKKEILEQVKKGYNVILRIDVQGAKKVKKQIPKALKIFIKPGNPKDLKRRMIEANTDKEQIKIRLKNAEKELKESKNFDHVVTNWEGKLNKAIKETAEIIRKIQKSN